MNRLAAVEARLDEYSGLLAILESKGEQVCGSNGLVTVYVGDGYFVDMPLEEAKQFVHKRVLTLDQQLQQAKIAEGITNDELPIMDIVEELDEDGNVVDVKVERADGSMEQIRELLRKVETAENTERNKHSPIEDTREEVEPRIKEIVDPEAKSEAKPEAEAEPAQEPAQEPVAQPEPSQFEPSSERRFNGISKEDMIQLEILEQDLNEVKMSEDDSDFEEFDEDFEEEYDEDASEESDEDEFGRTRGSLFPSDQRTTSLLERHIQQARTSKTGGKSVSFSPALEIKEFETSSAERKGKLENERPPSRFKMERQEAEDEAEAEADADTKAPPAKRSLFSQRLGRSGARATPNQSVEENAVKDTIVEKGVPSAPPALSKPSAGPKKFSSLSRKPSANPNAKVIAVPTSDQVPAEYEQLANDSVDIKDLEEEALHYFEEATIPDDKFLELHDQDDKPMGEDEDGEAVPDRPTMTGIVERASRAPQKLSEQDEDLKQIKADYQRLRQKLVYKAGGYKKTDNDKATDVVDEEGNIKSVSRFKAARLGLR